MKFLFFQQTLNKLIPIFLLLFACYSACLIYVSTVNKKYSSENHLILLAQEFTKYNVALSPYNIPSNDIVDYFGQQYLYFGPFPSMVLMPFVFIFGRPFPQISIGMISLFIAFYAIFSLAWRFKFNATDSLWLAIFFDFSTVFFATAITNITAFQVQVFATAFGLLALAEFFGKRRFFLIGLFIACAGMTRITLYVYILFFLLEILREKHKIRKTIYLVLPIVISLIVLGAYNYKRFHSFTETGYQYNTALKFYPMSVNVSYGFLNPIHIPSNLYAMLLQSPEAILRDGGGFVLQPPYLKVNPWGLAIWYTSPLFLLLIGCFKRGKYTISAIITTTALLIPMLLYFGIGYIQFGYRYSMEILPFLLILLFPTFSSKLSLTAKVLIMLGVLFNCLFIASLWGIYPHFNIYE